MRKCIVKSILPPARHCRGNVELKKTRNSSYDLTHYLPRLLPPFFSRFPRDAILPHQWLLAMLCYRFAVRISHHTRQPWCRGGRPAGGASGQGSSSADGPVDTSPGPGPEVVRHLQQRQRQLLKNSLELLEVRIGSSSSSFSLPPPHSPPFSPRGLNLGVAKYCNCRSVTALMTLVCHAQIGWFCFFVEALSCSLWCARGRTERFH